jgi:creatinine amidohydrolase
MNLLDFSWTEIEEYLKYKTAIFLPIGSVEEHGYHLPLSTDGDIALAVCNTLSQKTGILVAPIIWYGYSNSTRGYPGTIMVGIQELKNYIFGVLLGLKESGFKTVYIVSGHYSNEHITALVEAGKNIRGIRVKLLDFSKIDFSDILETKPMHACEAETSLMLYLFPQKVKLEKAVNEDIAFEGDKLKKTKSGVFGTPTKASKEKGKLLFERIIGELEKLL